MSVWPVHLPLLPPLIRLSHSEENYIWGQLAVPGIFCLVGVVLIQRDRKFRSRPLVLRLLADLGIVTLGLGFIGADIGYQLIGFGLIGIAVVIMHSIDRRGPRRRRSSAI